MVQRAQPILVRKYGGTSLADAESIRRAALQSVEAKRQGWRVVVVVSACGDSTDRLMERAKQLASDPDRRELDSLLSSGEQASAALLSMAIVDLGQPAISLTGAQCGIITNDVHCNARILEVRPGRILRELEEGRIVVATGFQGLSLAGEVTTLGRGGSDTSAVALAAALKAEDCQILTDVEGVYSGDPRKLPQARRLSILDSREMQELSQHGAQVLKGEAVEFAADNRVSLTVQSSASAEPGTRIDSEGTESSAEVFRPRHPPVAGVAGRHDLLEIRISDWACLNAELLSQLRGYDLVFSEWSDGGGSLRLFISTQEIPDPPALASELERRFRGRLEAADGFGAVSVVGFGVGSRPHALLRATLALGRCEIPIRAAFASRGAISFVVAVSHVDEGMAALHRRFVEEGDDSESPAEGRIPNPEQAELKGASGRPVGVGAESDM